MLEPNKNIIFEYLFSIYNRNLLKRRFNSLRISGFEFLIERNIKFPLIIYCNHSSWWDGLIAFQISRLARLNSFLMMEEKNLKRFFLFKLLGAFGVNRDNSRLAFESIKYSANLLKTQKNGVLWIFPQGEILNNDLRPITFYNGLGKIIEKVGQCWTISLSVRYEFLDQFKPDIFVKIGEPELVEIANDLNSKKLTIYLAEKMTINLNHLKSNIIKKNFLNFRSII